MRMDASNVDEGAHNHELSKADRPDPENSHQAHPPQVKSRTSLQGVIHTRSALFLLPLTCDAEQSEHLSTPRSAKVLAMPLASCAFARAFRLSMAKAKQLCQKSYHNVSSAVTAPCRNLNSRTPPLKPPLPPDIVWVQERTH
eukprot:278826-Amphidinium_carterae.1